MKRIIAVMLCMFVAFGTVSAAAGEFKEEDNMKAKSYYETLINKEVEYIKSLVLTNGAMPMSKMSTSAYSGMTLPEVDGVSPSTYVYWRSGKIMPYFSSFAALGIIEACKTLGNQNGREEVLSYINWYIGHMNTSDTDLNGISGTVYDYFIFQDGTDGKTIEVTLHDAYASQFPTDNPHDYDSTDSYASIFLELLYEYTNTFDVHFLDDKKELIDTLVSVIFSTYIEDIKLTGAKPTYMVAYLMDNCEVYRGLVCAAELYRTYFKDDKSADNADSFAAGIKDAILENFWQAEDKAFTAGVFEDGSAAYLTDSESMQNFYPQQTAQLFPIIFGLITAEDDKAKSCYSGFNTVYGQTGVAGHDWTTMNHGDAYPWTLISRAAVLMGDFARANKYIESVEKRFIKLAHSSPYYNAEAGHILVTLCALYTLTDVPEEAVSEESSSVTQSEPAVSNLTSETSAPDNKGIPGIGIAAIIAGVVAVAGICAAIVFSKKNKN